jgi:hypothetical protein
LAEDNILDKLVTDPGRVWALFGKTTKQELSKDPTVQGGTAERGTVKGVVVEGRSQRRSWRRAQHRRWRLRSLIRGRSSSSIAARTRICSSCPTIGKRSCFQKIRGMADAAVRHSPALMQGLVA